MSSSFSEFMRFAKTVTERSASSGYIGYNKISMTQILWQEPLTVSFIIMNLERLIFATETSPYVTHSLIIIYVHIDLVTCSGRPGRMRV